MSSPTRTPEERFWEKVNKQGPIPANRPELGPCWVWTGYVDVKGNGYGQFWSGVSLVKPHRFSYLLAHGTIPFGMVVDHVCHNNSGCIEVACLHRRCCNPAHLEAVTQKINSIRGRSGDHQSAKTHCPAGHSYSLLNTILRNGGRQRVCRECNRRSQARYNAKRKALAHG